MKKDDLVYLDHILLCINKLERFIAHVSEQDFLANEEKQDAVIRNIELIGEATKRLSNELTERFYQLPWREITGMRDKLAHDYIDVDLETVWQTASVDVPELKSELLKIVGILEREARQ